MNLLTQPIIRTQRMPILETFPRPLSMESGTPLSIYLLTWDHDNRPYMWADHYQAAIVIAENEKEARKIHPQGDLWYYSEDCGSDSWHINYDREDVWIALDYCWAETSEEVVATRIGTADFGQKKGVILASFHSF